MVDDLCGFTDTCEIYKASSAGTDEDSYLQIDGVCNDSAVFVDQLCHRMKRLSDSIRILDEQQVPLSKLDDGKEHSYFLENIRQPEFHPAGAEEGSKWLRQAVAQRGLDLRKIQFFSLDFISAKAEIVYGGQA